MKYPQSKLLMSGDIETNPGPNNGVVSTFKRGLTVATINVNGVKDRKKLKRITNFINTLPFRENSVICIQETHLTSTEINSLRCQWRGEIVFSPSDGARGGVAILYKKGYFDEITDSYFDANARLCSFTATKNDEVYFFISLYAPTEHVHSLHFYNRIEQIIEEQFQKNSLTRFIISGDFNLVLDPAVDSIGRQQTRDELKAVSKLKEIMTKYSLTDTYREMNTWGGFT